MSATYRISKSESAQYAVVKNGKAPSLLTASKLRQLCQTIGERYAHLIAELDKADVVELSVAYGKVQTFTSDRFGQRSVTSWRKYGNFSNT